MKPINTYHSTFVKFFILISIFIFLHLQLQVSLCVTSNLRSGSHLGEEPMLLNVTYTTPFRELEEQKKVTMEHLNYIKKVKRLEQKFAEDIELLKMIMNVQNSQIEKLNEIIMVNHIVTNELLNTKYGGSYTKGTDVYQK